MHDVAIRASIVLDKVAHIPVINIPSATIQLSISFFTLIGQLVVATWHWDVQRISLCYIPLILHANASLHLCFIRVIFLFENFYLQAAANVSNPEVLATFVCAGVDIDTRNANGRTTLHDSIWDDNPERVRQICRLGADLKAEDPYGFTAFTRAMYLEKVQAGEVLLECESDLLELPTSNGWHPLHWAAYYDQLASIEFLKENGANVDALAPIGDAPLHVATRQDHLPATETLLLVDADIKARSREPKHTHLHLAVGSDNLDMVDLLVRYHAPLEEKDRTGHTALAYAAHLRKLEAVGVLHNHGANLDTVDSEGMSPVHRAVLSNQTAVLSKLLELGANVNAGDAKGRTALHLAAETNCNDAIRALAPHADLNLTNTSGLSALDIAATEGNDNAIEVLLELGANVGALTRFLYLHSIEETHREILQRLGSFMPRQLGAAAHMA